MACNAKSEPGIDANWVHPIALVRLHLKSEDIVPLISPESQSRFFEIMFIFNVARLIT